MAATLSGQSPPAAPAPAVPPPVIPAKPEAAETPVAAEPVPAKPATPPTDPDPDSVLFPPILPGEKPVLPGRTPRRARTAVPLVEPEPVPQAEADVPFGLDLREQFGPGLELNPAFVDSNAFREQIAMNQALGTGETLLGDLSGVRGVLESPFAMRRPSAGRTIRLGAFEVQPRASVGVAYTHRSGGDGDSTSGDNGDDSDGGEVDPFFQLGVIASFQRGQMTGVLGYAIGLNPQSGESGGEDSGSNDLGQDLYLTSTFRIPQIPRIAFSFGLSFTGLSGPNRDVGGATDRQIATASFGASYQYSQKTSFDLNFSLPIRDFSDGVSSTGATGTFFVNNQITKKTRVGLGFTYGSLDTEVSGTSALINSSTSREGSDGVGQTFQRFLFQIDSRPSKLLTYNFTGGLESRDAGGYSDLTPTFGLAATWNPIEGTAVTLAGERRGFNSAASLNTNYTSTSVSLNVAQRLAYRLSGYVRLGYERAEYYDVGSEDNGDGADGGEGGRKDDLFHASAGLNLPISDRWGWSLVFTLSDNRSDTAPFRYYQAVLQTSYAF